jgi:predicted RNA methylase
MEDIKFRISPKSFYQTNSKQAYRLYSVVREFADLKGDEVLYDLYTGTGTIGLFLSKKAKKVLQTSINLSSKIYDENDIFGSSPLARNIVRVTTNMVTVISRHIPQNAKEMANCSC